MVRYLNQYSGKLKSIFSGNTYQDPSIERKYRLLYDRAMRSIYIITMVYHITLKVTASLIVLKNEESTQSANLSSYFYFDTIGSGILLFTFIFRFIAKKQEHIQLFKVAQFLIIYIDFYVQMWFIYENSYLNTAEVYFKTRFTRTISIKSLQLLSLTLTNINSNIYFIMFTIASWSIISIITALKLGLSLIYDVSAELTGVAIFPFVCFQMNLIFQTSFRKKLVAFMNKKVIIRYFNGLIKNLNSSVITYKDSRPCFINLSFYKTFSKFIVSNDLKELYQVTNTNRRRSCAKLKHKSTRSTSTAESNINLQSDKKNSNIKFNINKIFTRLFRYSHIQGPQEEIKLGRSDSLLDLMNKHAKSAQFSLRSESKIRDRFFSLGTFYFDFDSIIPAQRKTYYFEASIRLFRSNKNLMTDLIINNVSEIVSQQLIISENRVKQTLFAKIAHEFKTPIITITSELESLKDNFQLSSQLDKEVIEKISKKILNIQSLGWYTIFLINDIIQYSSQIDYVVKPLDIADINEEIMNFCARILEALLNYWTGNKSKVSFKLSFLEIPDGASVILNTDSIRLKQILLNIISNSVKFTSKGSISLSAKLINDTNKLNSYYVEFQIEDTGPGINPAIIESIYSSKVCSISTYDYNNSMGTGLGLNIVKSLSDKLGAAFSINSKLTVGTTFQIKFPVTVKVKQLSIMEGLSANNCSDSYDSVYSETVLYPPIHNNEYTHTPLLYVSKNLELEEKDAIILCDDSNIINNSHKRTIRDMLTNEYEYIMISDGIQLLEVVFRYETIKNSKIKLVICDENMQFMNGSQAISILRAFQNQNKWSIKFPIYCATAFSDDTSKFNILASGFTDILAKPLTKSVLRDLLEVASLN